MPLLFKGQVSSSATIPFISLSLSKHCSISAGKKGKGRSVFVLLHSVHKLSIHSHVFEALTGEEAVRILQLARAEKMSCRFRVPSTFLLLCLVALAADGATRLPDDEGRLIRILDIFSLKKEGKGREGKGKEKKINVMQRDAT